MDECVSHSFNLIRLNTETVGIGTNINFFLCQLISTLESVVFLFLKTEIIASIQYENRKNALSFVFF